MKPFLFLRVSIDVHGRTGVLLGLRQAARLEERRRPVGHGGRDERDVGDPAGLHRGITLHEQDDAQEMIRN